MKRPGIIAGAQLSSSGGSSYTAKAVHFDGSTDLTRGAALVGSDQTKMLAAFWCQGLTLANFPGILTSMPGNNCEIKTRENVAFQSNLQLEWISADFGADSVTDLLTVDLLPATWHGAVICVDTAIPRVQFMIDGTVVATAASGHALDFALGMSAESDFKMGSDGYGDFIEGDFAQVYLCFGTSLDLSVPEEAAKFIVGGKPVDLLTSGAPTPQILFDGDATGFVANQGSGGAFTLTGTLTNASTSPSD